MLGTYAGIRGLAGGVLWRGSSMEQIGGGKCQLQLQLPRVERNDENCSSTKVELLGLKRVVHSYFIDNTC